jgi:hypothetical protein
VNNASAADDDGVDTSLGEAREGRVHIAFGRRIHLWELEPKRARRSLHLF